MTDEEYDAYLGQREFEEGSEFQRRMISYLAVWVAICQTGVSEPQPEYMRPEYLWRLLCIWMQRPQIHDWLMPMMICTFIEVAGQGFEEVFGEWQWFKWRSLFWEHGKPDAEDDPDWIGKDDVLDVGDAGRQRLKVILEEWDEGETFSEGRLKVYEENLVRYNPAAPVVPALASDGHVMPPRASDEPRDEEME